MAEAKLLPRLFKVALTVAPLCALLAAGRVATYKPLPDRMPPAQVEKLRKDENREKARAAVKERAEKLERAGNIYRAAFVYIKYCDKTGDCALLVEAKKLADKLVEKGDARANKIYDELRKRGFVFISLEPAKIEDLGGPTARQAAEFRLQASNAEKNGDFATAAKRWQAAGTDVDKTNAKRCADKFAEQAQAETDIAARAFRLQQAIDTYRAIGAGEKAAGLEIILNELKKSPKYLEKIGKKLEAAHVYLDKNDAGNANRLRNELADKAKTRKDRADIAELDARIGRFGVTIPKRPWVIDDDGRAERSAEDQRRAKRAERERTAAERRATEDAARRAEARRQEQDRLERERREREAREAATPFNADDYLRTEAKPVYTRSLAGLITRYRNEGRFGDAASITIKFTIGTDGRAKNASARLSEGKLPAEFQTDFEKALAPLKFPAPKEEVSVELNPRLK